MIEEQDEVDLNIFDTSEAETNLATRLPQADSAHLIRGQVSRDKFVAITKSKRYSFTTLDAVVEENRLIPDQYHLEDR